MKPFVVVVALLAGLGLAARPTPAQRLRGPAVSLDALVARATLVVEGRVGRHERLYLPNAGGFRFYAYRLHVYKVFKGQVAGDTLTVLAAEMGFDSGLSLRFTPAGVLLLEPATRPRGPDGRRPAGPVYQVVGGEHGFLKYTSVVPGGLNMSEEVRRMGFWDRHLSEATGPGGPYRDVAATLYPRLVAATGQPYRTMEAFDPNTYNQGRPNWPAPGSAPALPAAPPPAAKQGPIGRAQVTPHPTTTDYLGEPVPQLVAKATAVFEGKVISGHSFWNSTHKMIYTTHTVEVYKVFKGQMGPTVEIVTEGGITEDAIMDFSHGFSLGDRAAGLFFAVPFHEAAHRPAVPAGQVYRVVDGGEGFFKYGGMPPFPNAADTPYVRYTNIETSLYPLIEQAAGGPYRELKPFDINRYNKLLERRGIDSQLHVPGTPAPTAAGSKKSVYKSKVRKAPRHRPNQ